MKKILQLTFVIFTLLFSCIVYANDSADANLPAISFWGPETSTLMASANAEPITIEQIKSMITNNIINFDNYSEIKIKPFRNYFVATLFVKDARRINVVRINFDQNYSFVSMEKNYMPSVEQIKSQEENDTNTFLMRQHLSQNINQQKDLILIIIVHPKKFAPYSTDIAAAIYDKALKDNKRVVLLYGDGKPLRKHPLPPHTIIEPATLANIKYYLKSPNLKGVFYDGDANNANIVANDGLLSVSELKTWDVDLSNTVFIAVACDAFQAPLGKEIVEDSKAKVFMAGITELDDKIPDWQGGQTFLDYMFNNTDGEPFSDVYLQSLSKIREKYDVTKPIMEYGIWGMAGSGVKDLFPDVKKQVEITDAFSSIPIWMQFKYSFPNIPKTPGTDPKDISDYGIVGGDTKEFGGTISEPVAVYTITRTSPSHFNSYKDLGDDYDNFFQVYAFNKFTGTPVSKICIVMFDPWQPPITYIGYEVPWWIIYYKQNKQQFTDNPEFL